MYKILIKKTLKGHIIGITGVFILMTLVSIMLPLILSLSRSSKDYIERELDRVGYGDLMIQVTLQKNDDLKEQLIKCPSVDRVESEDILVANYRINGRESTYEGQFVTLDKSVENLESQYKFFNKTFDGYIPGYKLNLEDDSAYVPVCFVILYDAKIGDDIEIVIGRNGIVSKVKIEGFYEDPSMGSVAIGNKAILINSATQSSLKSESEKKLYNALARSGARYHLHLKDSKTNSSQVMSELKEKTNVFENMEWICPKESVINAEMFLIKEITAILLAVCVVLITSIMIVMRTTMKDMIENGSKNIAVLKCIGLTSKKIRIIYIIVFLIPIITGILVGFICVAPVAGFVYKKMVLTTGFLIPVDIPKVLSFLIMLGVLIGFIVINICGTIRINRIDLLEKRKVFVQRSFPGLNKKNMYVNITYRQLITGLAKYLNAMFIAAVLVFSLTFVSRVSSWVKKDSHGLSNAFSITSYDIGVTMYNKVNENEIERAIKSYSEIEKQYMIANPTISMDGVAMTSNVISDISLVKIKRGQAPLKSTHIVVTEHLLDELGLKIGSSVNLQTRDGSGTYTIVGTYQCITNGGINFAMSSEGYNQIAENDKAIWSLFYVLDKPERGEIIRETLKSRYGENINVYDVSSTGISAVKSLMDKLTVFMYIETIAYILVTVFLLGRRVMAVDKHNLDVLGNIGLTYGKIVGMFMARFLVAGLIGGIIGSIASGLTTDICMSFIMNRVGISGFVSSLSITEMIMPIVLVSFLYAAFAGLYFFQFRQNQGIG